ncbi:hypothetical protein [Algoriphagus sp. CAU 1675]|uniref:hypothetical protein n=1 Tax=Algoriphagus sp. CAU 1675 TaxID=3032597 RepID=UPI0023DB4B7C|nr:hypothetical protein [Algoriphagus sp. CAU 1675]MDF2157088.1 hypothetical protein [Algoriphagus sp. CAU 1675]
MGRSDFHLEKWYLDFVGRNGEIMIFYAAKLSFKSITVHYASWINYQTQSGLKVESHFRHVNLPEKKGNLITWKNDAFQISGSWQAISTPIQARIVEDHQGYLDWNCFQPASNVQLKIKDKTLEGTGYAELLTLTTYPWNIPMNHLRWGRFHSFQDTLVWIELRGDQKQQWVWLNRKRLSECTIENDQLSSTEEGFSLTFDRGIVLESEKKIGSVVKNILRFIPGFNHLMNQNFLTATNHKWFSKCEFQKKGCSTVQGSAIHEWVNFNSDTP